MRHPLIFLTVKSFTNGLRRSVTSPKRLIGLIGAALYYLSFLARQSFAPSGLPMRSQPHMSMPPLESAQAVVFLVFAGLSLILALQTVNYRGGFRPADVDVLFATPVDPKTVLVFRMLRDYVLTLLIPLLFMLVSWRPTAAGFQYMFRNFPEHGGYVFKAASLAWILMAMVWVAIGYAASLFVNRTDMVSDRNRKRIGWSLFGIVAFVVLYSSVVIRSEPSWDTVIGLTENPLMRVIWFTATAATQVVMAPLTGDYWTGALGCLVMIGLIVVAVSIAMTQVGWMYDQAAARGFDSATFVKLRRRGDTYGLLVEQARRGRVRSSKLSRRFAAITVRGPAALVWKEFILQTRGSIIQTLVMIPLGSALVAIPVWTTGRLASGMAGITYLAALGFLVFIFATGSQAGFIELLRRVDLQKPLPFTPSSIVFWEVAAKTLPVIFVTALAALPSLIIRPEIWPYVLCSLVAAPLYALTVISAVLLVTVLFPDVDDPTQRGFRQLMLLIGIVVVSLPSIAAFGGLTYLGVSPLLTAIPFGLLNLAIAVALSSIAGALYATYNPSE